MVEEMAFSNIFESFEKTLLWLLLFFCVCSLCVLVLLVALPLLRREQNTQGRQKSLASEHFKSSSVPLLRIVALEGKTA